MRCARSARASGRTPRPAARCCSPATCWRRWRRRATASSSSTAAAASPRAASTTCSPSASGCARPSRDQLLARAARARPRRQPGRPGHRDRRRRRPRHRRPRRPRQRRRPARDEHPGRARGALRRPHGGVVRTELAALRSVPALPPRDRAGDRVLRLPRDLVPRRRATSSTTALDGRAQRAVLRRRRRVRGRRLRGRDGGRGGRARRARARAARRRRPPPGHGRPARRPRGRGRVLGVGGAVMAAVLTFALMGFGGGPLPGAGDVLARGARHRRSTRR